MTSYYYVGDDDERMPVGLGGSHLNVMSYMGLGIENTGGESMDSGYKLPSYNTNGTPSFSATR